MKELEKLLSSLIKKGWEPWNRKADFCEYMFWKIRFIKESGEIVGLYTLRSIVSLESGLWQFVCDEQLCKLPEYIDAQWCKTVEDDIENEKDLTHILTEYDYRYRLLESALIPEKELVKFLIENIVIEWNSK